MASHRQERLEQLIIQVLGSMIIMGEVKDPRVSTLVSISEVQISKDFSNAKIGISGYMDDEELESAVEGLNSAAGFIQSKLAKHLQTRLTPKLKFHVNRNIKTAFELSKKIDEIGLDEEDSGDTAAE